MRCFDLDGALSRAALVAGALALASCAGVAPGGDPGPAADAPKLRVGDRWVYRGTDGFRVQVVWDETHEITAIGPQDITVKVTLKGTTVDIERTETWSAPGVVLVGAVYQAETSRFDPALIRYRFPLTPGERWGQSIRDLDKPPGPYGPIRRHVTVGGWDKVPTPAGTFDAIRMRIILTMDDETFWRWPTEGNFLVWYAPAVGASVREEKRSHYREKGGLDVAFVPGQNATLELVSFTPGK
jgi:hypothetical protein